MLENTADITVLLRRWRDGDRSAEDELFTCVLPYLRRLAHHLMRRERKGHSLQPTELIDQAYLRMVSARDRDWRNRQHFFAIAARAMRRQLIDHARGRPSADFVPLEGLKNLLPGDSAKIETGVVVDRLLDQLSETQPEWCTLIELKYFLGLTDEQIADAMGLKLRTLQRMWRDARQWLFEHMEGGNAQQGTGR